MFLSFSQCREVGSLNNLNRFLDSHFLNLDPKLLDKVDRSTDDAMDTDGPMDGTLSIRTTDMMIKHRLV